LGGEGGRRGEKGEDALEARDAGERTDIVSDETLDGKAARARK
jgi:hypothetical protein